MRDTLPALTGSQIAALIRFARENGRRWKAELNDQWMRAATSGDLQTLRNTHGPSWLAGFRLPKGVL